MNTNKLDENIHNREHYIRYIDHYVKELTQNQMKEIYQMIVFSDIDESGISEKNVGMEIKFDKLNDAILKTIYIYVYNKTEVLNK